MTSAAARAGFVLVGGASRRMGRDKALLPMGPGVTLVEEIAGKVRSAAGNVTLIGPPEKYRHLNLAIVHDKIESCGPIGGLYTALRLTDAEWNMLAACDMPNVTAAFLAELFEAAEASDADCVVPRYETGLHPLCAVYHRRIAPAVESAIHHKVFKMHDFISTLRTIVWPVTDPSLLHNVNTPAEWSTR